MGIFRYRTIDNSSSNGKFKIYLCAHKDEIYDFLDSFSNLILTQYSNCAIWYYDEESKGEEISQNSYDENLSQMRLFLVPVTKKFLKKNNRAFDKDFKYAKDHNIPTLLLLQDKELVEQFNEVCGKLHFINESDEKYEEKIKRFMGFLFADDKQIRKIKNSFDADIFLSYRKIDRKHAIRLTKLIHSINQNVSVWFDDYLTPGEKFDKEIRDAIKKCDFMAIVITPNVLKLRNYVEEKEYPLAKKTYHKKVIPFEMEHTDKQQLGIVLRNMDCCIDVSDEAMCIKTLKKELKKYQRNTKLASEEKDFLVGIAYLMGVNVERDASLGLELIKRSANAGNYEAMNKLYQMYRTGDCVNEDYKEAIIWKIKSIRKLCSLRYNSRYSYQKKKYGIEFIYSSLDLIDYKNDLIHDTWKYESLDTDFLFCSQGLSKTGDAMVDVFAADISTIEGNLSLFASFLYERYSADYKFLIALAKCQLCQGMQLVESGDDKLLNDAKKIFECALSMLEDIPNKDKTVQQLVAEIYTELAKLPIGTDNILVVNLFTGKAVPWLVEEAKSVIKKMLDYSTKAIELLEQLRIDNPEDLAVVYDLKKAYCARLSGCICSFRTNGDEKQKADYKECFYRIVEISKELVARNETRMNLIDLRNSYLSFLFEVENDADFFDVLDDEEQRGLYNEVAQIEEILKNKWNIEKRFTNGNLE